MDSKTLNKENISSDAVIKIIVAVIGILGTIIAALINQNQLVDFFLSRQTIEIPANPYYSGISSRNGNLNSFDGSKPVVGFGDTSENRQVRSFLSFYLGDIPVNAEIIDAELLFSCDLYGNPNTMGRVWIKEYPFWPYSQSDYSAIEKADSWMVSWPKPEPMMMPCLRKKSFLVSTNSLPAAVQSNIQARYFQIGIYFEKNLIIANDRQDAIVFTDLPVLIVKYRVP